MKKEAEFDYRLLPLPEDLATQFLSETLAVIAPFEIYGPAHDALWDGYFAELKRYLRWNDLSGDFQLPRPKPLPLFVDAHTLSGFFRAWLRKNNIDPDSVFRVAWGYEATSQGMKEETNPH